MPYTGAGADGLGKPLKPITHPLRADLPIWLGAEGPKNVALAAEIADGWLAVYYSEKLADQYNSWLDDGFTRPGARRSRADFEVAANVSVTVTDDPAAEFDKHRPIIALYAGGNGCRAEELPRGPVPAHGVRRGRRRGHRALPCGARRPRRPLRCRTS